MLTELHTNPTQLTGLLAFAFAALACARTAARRHSAVWRGLAAAQAAFFIEVLIGLRHRVHDIADALLQHQGWYAERGPWQVALIAVIAVVAGLGIAALAAWWRWKRSDGSAALAVLVSMVVLFAFLIEAISLHRVDAAMYAMVGPVKRIALVWAAGAAVAALTALQAARRGDMPPARRR